MRVIALALFVLAACVPPRPAWIPAERPFVVAAAGFEVSPPPGWMRGNFADAQVLVATRDGLPLQRIAVAATEVGKPIGKGAAKRPVQAGMSPQELAELVIDDLQATNDVTDVRVVENAPATLSGRSAFRVLVSYRNARGLPMGAAVYGLLEAGRFYRIVYIAPKRHYFQLDLPTVEDVARSFRLRTTAPPTAGTSPST
jgi:hypothetical protein